jgi:nitroimidazol reductase NimA-like FMN-containing flavoprotein (pyridoxamine 5'-phosphate oxidase superfamily)
MDSRLHEKVCALIQGQGTCVLATASENQPYCSLMAYTTNNACSEIYLITHKESRKYHNIIKNPVVSLLIDTRQDRSKSEYAETMALTLSGRFQPITERLERERIREELFQRHPEFRKFFKAQEGEPLRVIIESVLLLEGPAKALYGLILES